ncbi:MAG: starch-binding outer membrane protein SusD/RagB family [Anaerophaga sp.]|uniref:RagB/SusD family nutrient uptake outer membrane protein n=1 Tax=Anaerophaga thermohalophila TaxID=177400 RepID=UPI000237BE5F|nr:RagB/SusD family nutrient uptake outer membrane protein [Anaerophaga thermohalophila]MDI3520068.1 starch-binding outer membrane protein SusD/RagB family [Anaerophaga sp.]MDK2842197.1 starch-binding outer membrane protein SusD/RagB family [Anaerophaga sp.]
MKNRFLNIIVLALFVAAISSCNDFLEEEPKSQLSTDYLESAEGVEAAVNAAYSSLRYFYTGGGSECGIKMTCYGTDEWQKGPDGNEVLSVYGDGIKSAGISMPWTWGYTEGINPCNAVLAYAPDINMPEEDRVFAMAQASFLRAFWYFILVQTYGEVTLTLDLPAEPTTTAERNTLQECFEAIKTDVDYAVANLPAQPTEPGRATQAAALHLRSKLYLWKATSDVSAGNSDYQQAYDDAMEIINNQGRYGLAIFPDFFEMFYPGNEHNSETIFTCERNTDVQYNDYADDNFKSNMASFYFRPNYNVLVSGLSRSTGYYYGRPWHRLRPTDYLLEHCFADRTDDKRYENSFQTVWLFNDADAIDDPNFSVGDTAIWLPGVETGYNTNAHVKRIFTPSEYFGGENSEGLSIYPALTKFNDIDRPSTQDPSVRPIVIYRLGETYLNAAEAAMYLNKPGEAHDLVAVIRERAAYDPDRSSTENAIAAQRLVNRIPVLDGSDDARNWLLDERARELAGEFVRWYDLTRSRTESGKNQLVARLNDHLPAMGYPVPASGNVEDYHALRPIPQEQIDLTTNEYPQNPGY